MNNNKADDEITNNNINNNVVHVTSTTTTTAARKEHAEEREGFPGYSLVVNPSAFIMCEDRPLLASQLRWLLAN